MSEAEKSMRATRKPGYLRRRSEQGSALLIVFVFAAMLAIMLYMELPVAAFEAQRAREQLLVDRGNEYAHAVKLYVRKFGTYPPSINALENTDRIRFLRHRFKDPMTGKDDWRFLHAGPGGQLIDSKVNPAPVAPNGTSGGMGSIATSSSASASSNNQSSGFANTGNGFGSQSDSNSSGQTVVAAVPQRPPAVAANGSPTQSSNSLDPNQSPTVPLLQTGDAAFQGQAASTAQNGQPATAGGNTPGTNGSQPTGSGGAAAGGGAMATVQNLLNNPNNPGVQPTPSGPAASSSSTVSSSTQSAFGQISSGGIAGVASKAEGHSIKSVNDQTNYSLWEFYYDLTKDATRGIANAAANAANSGVNNGSSGSSIQSTPGQNTTTMPSSTSPVANPTAPTNPPQ